MSKVNNNPCPSITMSLQQINFSAPRALTTAEQIARIPEENKIEAQERLMEKEEAITKQGRYCLGAVASAGAWIAGAYSFAGIAAVNNSLYVGGIVGLVLSTIYTIGYNVIINEIEDEAKQALLYGKDAKYVRLLEK
jgi:hypothetical protein